MDPAEHMQLTQQAIAADRIAEEARRSKPETEDDEYADDQPTPDRRPA